MLAKQFLKKFSSIAAELVPFSSIQRLNKKINLQSFEAPEPENIDPIVKLNSELSKINTVNNQALESLSKRNSESVKLQADDVVLIGIIKSIRLAFEVSVFEKLRHYERLLISQHLPIFFATSKKTNQKFSFLKRRIDRDKSGQIEKFFTIPIVYNLLKILETPEFQKMVDFRWLRKSLSEKNNFAAKCNEFFRSMELLNMDIFYLDDNDYFFDENEDNFYDEDDYDDYY